MLIMLGKRGKRLSWTAFDTVCLDKIGYTIPRDQKMSTAELKSLGFNEAADNMGRFYNLRTSSTQF